MLFLWVTILAVGEREVPFGRKQFPLGTAMMFFIPWVRGPVCE